jgi:hypothetical protein
MNVRTLFTICLIALTGKLVAQINLIDSTVQVINYWSKGEKQSYSVSSYKYKIKDSDTISTESVIYDIDVKVKGASKNSYTIEWVYRHVKMEGQNPAVSNLFNLNKDMKIIYRTDELGVFVEVVNWKQIQKHILKASAALNKKLNPTPELKLALKQIESLYASKAAIESSSIKDIQQFHTFHGAKYKLGEQLEGEMKLPNILGPEPFDATFLVFLEEINPEENNYILHASQEIDKSQISDATFNFLVNMAKAGNIAPPARAQFDELRHETLTSSRIHNSGWLIYSIQSTTVSSDAYRNVEERIIEIK